MAKSWLVELPLEILGIICTQCLLPSHFPKQQLFVEAKENRDGARDLCNLSQTCRRMQKIVRPMIAPYFGTKLGDLDFDYISYVCRIVQNRDLAFRETLLDICFDHFIGDIRPETRMILHSAARDVGVERLWFPWVSDQPLVINPILDEDLDGNRRLLGNLADYAYYKSGRGGINWSEYETMHAFLRSVLLEIALLHLPNVAQLSLPLDLEFRELPPELLPSVKTLALRDYRELFPQTSDTSNSLNGASNLINAACNLQGLYVEGIRTARKELFMFNLEWLIITKSIMDAATLGHILRSCRNLRSLTYEPAAQVNIDAAAEIGLSHEHPSLLVQAMEPVFATLETLRLRIPEWDQHGDADGGGLGLVTGQDLHSFERLKTLELSVAAVALDHLIIDGPVLIDLIPPGLESFTLTGAGPEWLRAVGDFVSETKSGLFPNLRVVDIPGM
ncbi:hypothetical protein KJ359_001898 [Pestalotiopsis sp. 9143b]|nr:hypothetical protein KJ359_001898 [Pestalotiopsis sp. 9143b]